jgi:hypothetical protein
MKLIIYCHNYECISVDQCFILYIMAAHSDSLMQLVATQQRKRDKSRHIFRGVGNPGGAPNNSITAE